MPSSAKDFSRSSLVSRRIRRPIIIIRQRRLVSSLKCNLSEAQALAEGDRSHWHEAMSALALTSNHQSERYDQMLISPYVANQSLRLHPLRCFNSTLKPPMSQDITGNATLHDQCNVRNPDATATSNTKLQGTSQVPVITIASSEFQSNVTESNIEKGLNKMPSHV